MTTKTVTTLEGIHEEALLSYEACADNNQEATRELLLTLDSYGMSVAQGEATIKQAKKDHKIVDGLSAGMFRHVKMAVTIINTKRDGVEIARGKTAREILGLARRINEKAGADKTFKPSELLAGATDWDSVAEAVKAPRKAGKTASEKEAEGKATITSLDNVGDVLTDIFNSITEQAGRNKFLSILEATTKTLKAYNDSLARDGVKVPA